MKGFINKHSPIEPICTVRMHCILTVLFSSPDRRTQPGEQINTQLLFFFGADHKLDLVLRCRFSRIIRPAVEDAQSDRGAYLRKLRKRVQADRISFWYLRFRERLIVRIVALPIQQDPHLSVPFKGRQVQTPLACFPQSAWEMTIGITAVHHVHKMPPTRFARLGDNGKYFSVFRIVFKIPYRTVCHIQNSIKCLLEICLANILTEKTRIRTLFLRDLLGKSDV